MAYTFEQSYYFRPYRGNSSFWLNRYGNGSIASHQKATLYTAAGSADQRLKVHKVSGGCQLLSDLNNAYGLNIYGRGAGSVCDFYPVSGNESDALIDLLTVDATNNLYRIKMINHNLYLTPASNSSGAALTWENASNADNQIWQLCASQSSGGTSTGDYVWPTKSTRITQSYSSGHTGIDIGAVTPGVEGDPIYAFCSGKVKRVFNWNASQGTSDNASMGNCVFIQSANPKPGNGGSYLRTIYALLRKVRFNAFPQNKSFITGDLDLPHTPSMRSRLLHVTNPRRTHSTRISHHAQQANRKPRADFHPRPA